MNINKSNINIQAYLSDKAVEKYSNYGLYPNEKYLFDTFFSKDKTILDLACGAGRTTVRLHELGYIVKGVDRSDRLINIARKRFPAIRFETGDYSDIKEENSSFDNILISHNGLDYAFPENKRIKAILECFRVIKPLGNFILSCHNIKSLHFSPYYIKERKWWLVKNIFQAFKSKSYIYDLGMYTFYCSADYYIRQIKQAGFKFIEMVGFRNSRNKLFNDFISPYNHYVFKKP